MQEREEGETPEQYAWRHCVLGVMPFLHDMGNASTYCPTETFSVAGSTSHSVLFSLIRYRDLVFNTYLILFKHYITLQQQSESGNDYSLCNTHPLGVALFPV